MTSAIMKDTQWTDREKRMSPLKMEAETGVTQPLAKKCLEKLGEEGPFSRDFRRERGPADTIILDFWPPEL